MGINMCYNSYMGNLKQNARFLRKNMTNQERKIWSILKNRNFYGFRFLRQFQIGNYIVDFVCRSKKIIIEIDGGQHNHEDDIEYDKNRTKYMNLLGYKVIRFWNNDIDKNIEGVYSKLKEEFGIKDC